LVFPVVTFLLVFLYPIFFLCAPIRATCPAHLILLDLIILEYQVILKKLIYCNDNFFRCQVRLQKYLLRLFREILLILVHTCLSETSRDQQKKVAKALNLTTCNREGLSLNLGQDISCPRWGSS
jgi:hypothetical protein